MVTEDPLADETGLGVDEGEEVKVPHYTLTDIITSLCPGMRPTGFS